MFKSHVNLFSYIIITINTKVTKWNCLKSKLEWKQMKYIHSHVK